MYRLPPILILISAIFLQADGQQYDPGPIPSYVIKLDPATRVMDKALPFDKSFTVILTPVNPQNILRVNAYPIIHGQKGMPAIVATPIANVTTRVSGAQAIVNFPAMIPDSHFDFALIRKFDGDKLDTLIQFFNLVAKNQILGMPAAQQHSADVDYSLFRRRIENEVFPLPTGITAMIYDYLFTAECAVAGVGACAGRSLDALFTPAIKGYYAAIFGVTGFPGAYPQPAGILSDLQMVSQKFKAERLNDNTITSLIRIYLNSREAQFFSGRLSFDNTAQTMPAEPEDIKQIIKNLELGYTRLLGLTDTLERLSNEVTAPNPTLFAVRDYVKKMAAQFSAALTTARTAYGEISSKLASVPGLRYTEWYTGNSNDFKDLTLKSPSIFSVHLGLSFLGVQKNDGANSVLPKLTIGVNINFKLIDKTIRRIDNANRDWRNYISGFAGLTFGKFNDPQFQNLFSSTSLLVGLNYKVSRSFYFSAGGTVLRQQYKNPVINDFHTKFGVYTALMLDIDIVHEISKVTDIIFK